MIKGIAAIDMPMRIIRKKYKLYQKIRIFLGMQINEVL
jgi:hypothetical protein